MLQLRRGSRSCLIVRSTASPCRVSRHALTEPLRWPCPVFSMSCTRARRDRSLEICPLVCNPRALADLAVAETWPSGDRGEHPDRAIGEAHVEPLHRPGCALGLARPPVEVSEPGFLRASRKGKRRRSSERRRLRPGSAPMRVVLTSISLISTLFLFRISF